MKRLLGSMVIGLSLLASGTFPAQAQRSCEDLYASMMRNYERGSPRYMERRAQYTQQCGRGRGSGEGMGRSGGMCEELRMACMHKGQLGERGEGNCRRYREMCRR